MHDPYDHLDGQVLTVRPAEFIEDPDGLPLGVKVRELPPALFHAPRLNEEGDDDDD